MPSFMYYKLLEACREPGCPVCRLEQQSVDRYLDNQFYENVNSPAWRDHLRASHGFCHEHVWRAVNQRLGDALGFSIIYHDVVKSLLKLLQDHESAGASGRRKSVRDKIEQVLSALKPRKRCPACIHRDQTTRDILSALVGDLHAPEMTETLQASHGLCLPHLRLALGHVHDALLADTLLTIQRARLENLKSELAEFIRKNDYQAIHEGFGREGDAWLRAIGMVAGSKREK